MKHHQTHDIGLRIDQDWTPEQALAVFELIDELRDAIWSRHGQAIQDGYRQAYGPDLGPDPDDTAPDEPPDKDPAVPF